MGQQWKAKRVQLFKKKKKNNSDLTSSGSTLTLYSNRTVLLFSSNKANFGKNFEHF